MQELSNKKHPVILRTYNKYTIFFLYLLVFTSSVNAISWTRPLTTNITIGESNVTLFVATNISTLNTTKIQNGTDAYFLNLLVGGTGETIDNAGFVMDGNDAFVADKLGVEGNAWFDNDLYVLGTIWTTNINETILTGKNASFCNALTGHCTIINGGTINATSNISTPKVCIQGTCKTDWSTSQDITENISTLNNSLYWNQSTTAIYPRDLTKKVGLGTNNPTQKLDVEGDIEIGASTDNNIDLIFNGTTGGYNKRIIADGTTLLYWDYTNDAIFSSASQVGIGITPIATAKLQVTGGDIAVANNYYVKLLSTAGLDDGTGFKRTTANATTFAFAKNTLVFQSTNDAAIRYWNSTGSIMYDFEMLVGESSFNEGAKNIDFRFEGLTDPNLLFLDASVNRIGIGNITPDSKLSIVGNISITGDIIADGNLVNGCSWVAGTVATTNCQALCTNGRIATGYNMSVGLAVMTGCQVYCCEI